MNAAKLLKEKHRDLYALLRGLTVEMDVTKIPDFAGISEDDVKVKTDRLTYHRMLDYNSFFDSLSDEINDT